MTVMPADSAEAWAAWFAAGESPAVDRALRALYGRLDAEIASRNPTCWLSGRCCDFDGYGHRLYVTGLEAAWLVGRIDPMNRARLEDAALPTIPGCPFQVAKLCRVHDLRPMGCRIFFCDPAAQDWQHGLYERFLEELRALHERHGLPYQYMEWRTALAEARTARPTAMGAADRQPTT